MLEFNSDADKYLLNVVDIFKKNASSIVKPFELETSSLEEYTQMLKIPGTKLVSQGGISGCLMKEVLISPSFTRCVPVIIRDNFNGYSALIHIDANEGRINSDQIGFLEYILPKGLYNAAIIDTNRSFQTTRNTMYELSNIRPDIFNFQVLNIQNDDKRYDVTYDPKSDNIFVYIEGKKEVLKTKGLDIEVLKYMPELTPLAMNYYEPEFWKTFHM